jgi:hypothetical protein
LLVTAFTLHAVVTIGLNEPQRFGVFQITNVRGYGSGKQVVEEFQCLESSQITQLDWYFSTEIIVLDQEVQIYHSSKLPSSVGS